MAGFECTGVFSLGADNTIRLPHKDIPDLPGLYAFVVGGEIMYIGSSNGSRTTLRKRMRSYARKQRQGSDSRPVHAAISGVLKDKLEVEIYTLKFDAQPLLSWQNLPVDLVLGLEAGLIMEINPPWNRRGRKLS